ncbi:hypothetical protein PVAND_012692 [Polypedilum vanderplanki]|uniref:Proton-coupled folate transporter-like protein n=1 Tax=Polypedilum vanderplanki TaxID=319348 RepID=A0A9J6CN83_POLVA|nr:hypothetical protein PVAND_012692 [Polypedilum vanderplanki]
MLKQSCIQFGYEKSLCDVISENNKNTTKIEEELQPYVAKIKVVITILNSSVPAVLQLFLGSWSDKNGRKKVINSAALGFVLTHTSITAVCYYSENILPLPAWIFIICYIPVNFLGGFSSIMITTFCYITDICEKPNRPYHFTLVELMMVTSIFFGAILCSFILSMSNVIFVFTTATICTLLGAIIVIIFVDESIQIVQNSSSSLKSILSTKHIIKMIRTCFKSRKLYGRSILLSLILIMTLNRFVSDEEKIIGYLYERMVFNWTLEDHNNYQAVRIIHLLLKLGICMQYH